MSYRTDETVIIETGLGHQLTLELNVLWQGAERDVGIMQDYIDEFSVIEVNGSPRHAKWVDKIIYSHDELPNKIIDLVYDGA